MYLNLNADYYMFVDGKIISVVVWNMLFKPPTPTLTTTNTHTQTQTHNATPLQFNTHCLFLHVLFI